MMVPLMMMYVHTYNNTQLNPKKRRRAADRAAPPRARTNLSQHWQQQHDQHCVPDEAQSVFIFALEKSREAELTSAGRTAPGCDQTHWTFVVFVVLFQFNVLANIYLVQTTK